MRAVRPSLPTGSSTEPVRKTRRTLTMGLLGTGSSTTFIGSTAGRGRYGTGEVGATTGALMICGAGSTFFTSGAVAQPAASRAITANCLPLPRGGEGRGEG